MTELISKNILEAPFKVQATTVWYIMISVIYGLCIY